MTKTVPIELSETVAEALTTPEGMERARALLEAEFAQDTPLTGDDLTRALRAKAQLEAGESVSLEESLSRGQEELRRRFEASKAA